MYNVGLFKNLFNLRFDARTEKVS